MTILVIAEHDQQSLKAATLNIITAARKIGGDIHVLVAGSACNAAAEQAAGVSRDTSLRSRGLAPDHEAEQRREEAAAAANAMTEPYTDPAAAGATQDPPQDPQPAPGA